MCDILPDLVVHLFTFNCKYIFFTRFYKTNRDFSRVSFAAELSTKLVYNIVLVIDYDNNICIIYCIYI